MYHRNRPTVGRSRGSGSHRAERRPVHMRDLQRWESAVLNTEAAAMMYFRVPIPYDHRRRPWGEEAERAYAAKMEAKDPMLDEEQASSLFRLRRETLGSRCPWSSPRRLSPVRRPHVAIRHLTLSDQRVHVRVFIPAYAATLTRALTDLVHPLALHWYRSRQPVIAPLFAHRPPLLHSSLQHCLSGHVGDAARFVGQEVLLRDVGACRARQRSERSGCTRYNVAHRRSTWCP